MKKSNNFVLMSLIVVIILVVIVYIVYSNTSHVAVVDNNPIACTQEAKLCPDGSYVSRSGPKCEFAECPAIAIPSGWQSYTSTSTSVSYNYPPDIGTTYVNTVDWPPAVQVLSEPFSCTQAGSVIVNGGKTEQRDINGQAFCITKESGGAAGSVYNNYAYAFEKSDMKVILTFSLRYPQCVNYDDPKKSACQVEENAFNVDDLVSKIVSTLNL